MLLPGSPQVKPHGVSWPKERFTAPNPILTLKTDIHISLNRDIYLLRTKKKKKKATLSAFFPGMFLPDSVCNPNPLAGLSQHWNGQVPGTGSKAGSDGHWD